MLHSMERTASIQTAKMAHLNAWLLALALRLAVANRVEVVFVAAASAELEWQALASLFVVVEAGDVLLASAIDGGQSACVLDGAALAFAFLVRFEIVVVAAASAIPEHVAESVLAVVVVAWLHCSAQSDVRVQEAIVRSEC